MKNSKHYLWIILAVGLTWSCNNPAETASGDAGLEEAVSRKTEMEAAAPNTLTAAEKEEGWMLLFDGETTKGWKSYCGESFPEKGWEIVDGSIHVLSSGKGEAGGGGDIVYEQPFKNFELSLEWKVQEGGNSGIFYLAKEQCGDNGEPIWKSAPEMQILDNERHPDARLGKDGNRQAGSLYDMIPAEPQNAKPAGEWNKASILVYNGTVVHNQNGENVVEYHLWTDDWKDMVKNSKFVDFEGFEDVAEEGYIGLQDHGDDVWFRNIKIKKM